MKNKKHITVIGQKNQGKTAFIPRLAQACPKCKTINEKMVGELDFKCNNCGEEYPLLAIIFDSLTSPVLSHLIGGDGT